MKKQNENKLFAFKVADKNKETKEKKWQARETVAVAGCSGPWTRADRRRGGDDQGMWC
ncbi:hypothetical protein [Flocculibacter collagenilyticus]|uniref:hypothetical protein n=1 Tax=Flocculibacter collagenilyticus TaxID=2744479 RepID=UPI0018F2ADFD|nr:hypothetical protein [Flocculibacter collagenilyticus]